MAEKTYTLNEKQIEALAKWANAKTTGWGPGFSAAFEVAKEVTKATTDREQG